MRRLRTLIVAALVAFATLTVPATADAVVVRRLDLPVLNPMPAERLVASGIIGIAGRPVVLQGDTGRNRAWVVLARSTSNATGAFRIGFVGARRVGALRMRVVGTPASGAGVATPVMLVRVTAPSVSMTTPTMSLAKPPSAGTVSLAVGMTVLAAPARRGRIVYVQHRQLGTNQWANFASRREGRTGSTQFSVPLPIAVANGYEYRATFIAPAGAIVSKASVAGPAKPVVVPPGRVPSRPVVALQAAPGPGAPPLESLGGSDADFSPKPYRWDPCRAISYRINVAAVAAGARSAGSTAIADALATLSRDSGLQFTSLGATTFSHPTTFTVDPPADRPGDTAMTIAFVAGYGSQDSELGSAYVRSQSSIPHGRMEIKTADIVIFLGPLFDSAAGTFNAPALREILLHELGHVAGLGHASDETVMAAIKRSDIATFSEYQRGDRAGLLAVGSPQGCLFQ